MIHQYVKVRKAATMLKCSIPHIYGLVRGGKLEAIRIGQRGIRIKEQSLNNVVRFGIDGKTPTHEIKCESPVVYFLQAEQGGLIKIGHAINVNYRFKTIQNQCPIKLKMLATISTAKVTEQEMHDKFSAFRRHGEWFEPSDELLAFVVEIAK